ncbi:protein of unknown function DUF309 [Pyrobaculum islandicum DSM 4184]|uniref:DUF309 domain-containing protein n=1 Tax=Pyrobaculum islandicum (strain DSM 4184 / JCM 9189 / GEO3) TaxID=384616 RepID=A1RRF9_PYRIL|nr:DUF309 domain-containing protein [Pyrobaculum islandicum]ABL87541.1 protein of unknown function DUF309 [Pyrobaculum islandicum DSM 4184]
MRYLIIAENPGYLPSHREFLIKQLRASLPVITIRVASSHVEVDVKTDDLETAVVEVERKIGRVLDVIDITFEEVGGDVEKYVELFNKERFWEAHNVLEGVWRKTREPTLQGLIMLAASFVKLQEGQLDKFERLIKEAIQLLEKDVGCIKIRKLRKKVEKALVEKKPFKIECL